MASGVDISAISGGVSSPVVAASASPANAASSGLSFASAVPAASATPIQNPRVIQDPTAGYITQYLSANGSQVVSQTPSAVTVAYLRQGLAADGSPKHPEAAAVATTA